MINYIKIENFYSSKEITQTMKKQATGWKKLFALPITTWLWMYLIHNTFFKCLELVKK